MFNFIPNTYMLDESSHRRRIRFDRDVRGSKRAKFKAIALVTVKPGIPLNTPRKGTRQSFSLNPPARRARTYTSAVLLCMPSATAFKQEQNESDIRKTRMKLFRATSSDLLARDPAKTLDTRVPVLYAEYFNHR